MPARTLALLLSLGLAAGMSAQADDASARIEQSLGLSVDSVRYRGAVLGVDSLARSMAEVDAAGELFLFTASPGARLVHVSRSPGDAPRVRGVPLWLSIVPPLIAIGLALLFKEVVSSLFVGILAGSFIAGGLRVDSFYYSSRSLWDVSGRYFIEALNDSGHLSVMVFSLLIGAMVALISRNGGMAGVVARLAVLARDRVSAQLSTYLLGIAIFFDDYANTLIVGNTMRQVTDRFGVSREKLAYLVDATAAPIASVAFITTWIGAELGYIESGFAGIEGLPFEVTPYAVFLESLQYSFYPILTLLFMGLLIVSRRDYGPMLLAERRSARAFRQNAGHRAGRDATAHLSDAIENDEFAPIDGSPLRSRYALLPVLTVVAVTVFGLLDTGMTAQAGELDAAGIAAGTYGEIWAGLGTGAGESLGFFRKLGLLIGAADSYVALLWASLSGVLVALAMTIGAKIMDLQKSMDTLLHGFGTMLPALVILTLAWGLAAVTEDLHTATFLTEALQGNIAPVLLPSLIFVLAAFISFSTGSSWSTMAILYPIAIPTTWTVAVAAGLDVDHAYALLLNTTATVLAASVLGDHCSPISDTTILSSLASGCDHLEHVRTQLPYALTVGAVALAGNLTAAIIGGGWWHFGLVVALGLGIFVLVIRGFGRPIDG